MMSRILSILFLSLVIICGCDKPKQQDPADLGRDGPDGSAMQHYFVANNPGKEVIKYVYKDLNDDGQEDLVVIYRVSKDKNMMRVILTSRDGYLATNEVPAPVSSQRVEFRDIDQKPPTEFIVQGTKGTKVGYAIFRIENGRLVDLFGEGMADCC